MGDDNWKFLPKLIQPSVLEHTFSFIKKICEKQTDPFTVTLHGGEPLLMGERRLESLFFGLRNFLSNRYVLRVQTNGLLLKNTILDLCAKYDVQLSVSIDGPQALHDFERVDFKSQGTHQKVENAINLINNHPSRNKIFSGVLSVINPQFPAEQVYEYFKKLSPPSVDFLYRDGNLDFLPKYKSLLSSVEYGKWMVDMASLYIDDNPSFSIRIIDDIIKLLLGGKSTKEGLGINDFAILVIDTDGTVTKNDTLKSTQKGADRFVEPWSVEKNDPNEILDSKEFLNYHSLQRPTAQKCLSCEYLATCGATMLLHRWSHENGFDNPSVYCSDQMYLISFLTSKVCSFKGKRNAL